MKKHYLFLISASLFLFYACSDSKQNSSDETTEVVREEVTTVSEGVCIWDKIALRDKPEEKGKWLTSINLGEKVTYLDETKTDDSGNKPREYVKVQLIDGKEGWALKDFIVIDGKAAVLSEDTEIYQRPDLLAKSGKSFSKMDVVAITAEKDDWLEITGKRKEGNWIESGWIKAGNLSRQDVDIAVAVYAKKAFEIKEKSKQEEELKKIVDNQDFSESIFMADLNEVLAPPLQAELKDDEIEVEELIIEEDQEDEYSEENEEIN